MKVSEIIEKLNDGVKVEELSNTFGVHRSTLTDRLKKIGYQYNNNNKNYEFIGDNSEKSEIDRKDFSELGRSNRQKIVGKKSEKIDNKVEKNNEFILTNDEIKFIKDSYKRLSFFDKKFEINWEKSQLPPKKPEKKVPYIISQRTFDEFKKFADDLENEYRISQNELVEIALQKFMREFQ